MKINKTGQAILETAKKFRSLQPIMIMAKMIWKYPIEEVHGALKKKVFGAAKRTTANAKGEQYNFSVCYGPRTKEVTEAERARWTKFGQIAAMVGTRRKNVTKRVQDMAAFKAQTAYKTFTTYLWSVCKAEWDTAHPQA